jgi:hypothetical protein
MSREALLTPKGWDTIAQGNALGTRSHINHPQPKGLGQATMSQPFRLPLVVGPSSQGVALGYGVPPLRGEELSPRQRFWHAPEVRR